MVSSLEDAPGASRSPAISLQVFNGVCLWASNVFRMKLMGRWDESIEESQSVSCCILEAAESRPACASFSRTTRPFDKRATAFSLFMRFLSLIRLQHLHSLPSTSHFVCGCPAQVVGGAPKREGLLVGLKNGHVMPGSSVRHVETYELFVWHV